MPMKTRFFGSEVRSRISCARRTRVRSISEALMSCAFSRVRDMAGKRFSVSQWASLAFQAASNVFGELFDGVKFLEGVERQQEAVAFIEINFDLLGQAGKFGGIGDVFLIIGFKDFVALEFSV